MLYQMMFIVISCVRIRISCHKISSNGRCLTNEKQTRFAFYGAMIAEGIVAIIGLLRL
jgi:carbon starvation protein CstA